MSRFSKSLNILFKITIILFPMFIVLLVIGLRPVDYTPYFETAYYQSTLERLLKSTNIGTTVSRGPLFVGLGRASLTPRLGDSLQSKLQAPSSNLAGENEVKGFQQLPLAGYIERKGQPATGVHDNLFASAVALRVGEQEVVLVTLDALIVSRTMAEGVIEQIEISPGLRRHQVLFGTTHTHSGPGGWGEGWLAEQFAGPYNPEVLRWMINQTVSAIQKAHDDLSPGTYGFGVFQAPHFVHNRIVGNKGTIDDDFAYVVLQQADGDYGILGSYAAHATVLSEENILLSADYCGYWRRRVEKEFSGIALFFAGGVGSHGPSGEGREFDCARYIGEGLANSLLNRLSNLPLKTEVSLTAMGLPIDLPSPHIRVSDGWRIAPWFAKRLLYEKDTYLQLVAIDGLLWVGTPCDFSGELSTRLKDFAQRRGHHAVITSFNGSYIGYVIPSKYYHYDSYESRLMSFFGPFMGDYFEELIQRMMVGAVRAHRG